MTTTRRTTAKSGLIKMINNIKNRRALWIALIGVSILLLALAVGQYARGGPLPLATGAPLWVTDIRDDRKLSGLADNIWFGQVMGKTGQVADSAPATHYSVVVFESLKRELSGMITVSQEGADMSNGQQFRIQGAPDLLEPGKSYLFITRADPAEGYHVVVPGVGNLLLDVDDNAGRAAVLGSTDANSLRERFESAIANEEPVPLN